MTYDDRPRPEESRLRGDDSALLLEDSIAGLLARTVAARPDAEALVFREHGLRLSWREFAQAVDRLATGLLGLGVGRGDRVGIWSPNRPEWVLTQFATARIGAILVNVNPAYRLAELEYALRHVGVRVLITADRFKTSDYVGMLCELLPPPPADGAIAAANLPDLRAVVAMGAAVPGMLRFDDVAATPADTARLDRLTAVLDPGDPINIQFTSGTTGLPKGATLSHRNIVNNANFVTARMGFTDRDRLCIPVPLYHCFGMVMGVLGCVTKGATMIFPGEGFDPDVTLECVAEEGCTALYGVPTMFSAMLASERFHHHDLSTLRTGIMAGAPCPIEVMKRVRAEMHMSQVTIAYGMTETSPVSFQSMTDDPVEKRVSTVGHIHPHLEVKLVDPQGHIVPTGAVGELCTRGYSVMRGYWNEPQKTAEAIDAEGWMHTGDLATIDADGYCSIVGRSKDMLIRGGENVYPREIEEFLYRHPKVREVQVIGIPDDRYGEEICACVMARDPSLTAEELRVFCKGQIAHYKVPRYVEFVDEFPMTVTGKVQKFILRDQMVLRIFPEAQAG
ncbi:AMP-binding protein [Paracoccus mangrovi]|jgi:fatty-acyl-CoA synthase|uniref:AMP-binding protein n=1 Tax=Paracoccus mangrovi TaxID=1715645 RepID=A0ABV7QYI2_9RHOB